MGFLARALPSCSTILALGSEALSPHPIHPLEMALIGRQAINPEIIDDQGPKFVGSNTGEWHYFQGWDVYRNGTITCTPEEGATYTFQFTGTQIAGYWSWRTILTIWREQGLRRGSTVV